MEVIPSIDLQDGMCVRLYQGDFERQTVFSNDPMQVAKRWSDAGAVRIHIVDLDGSRDGVPSNLDLISSIAKSVNIPVQVGGGIRSIENVEFLIGNGVRRVVVGTVAVENPDLVEKMCIRWGPETVVVALDSRGGKVAVKGWLEGTQMDVLDLAQRMAGLGVERFLYTDISRDGTMTRPNFEAVRRMVNRTGLAIQASGGVSSLDDIRDLVLTGAEGVVIGSCLYRGTVDLVKAINVAQGS
ncbi:1-(5-phosphoribosyl)-5-[(5-phosphoribosylamino)methylideneamino]imidazole-4-carboxamide isomerase [SAR202 cluster bacterium AD-804-J14_MRT_500m]|nr:1-(5-phosphoribosyl)-5-[(5-phosphoribosylamino)methylideneamino]imidazole-4-carboxamide isomerase [SAR202 cluster bacterium AD-804-J14_MRT_500m]